MLSNQDFYRILFSIYLYLGIHLSKEYWSSSRKAYLLALALVLKFYGFLIYHVRHQDYSLALAQSQRGFFLVSLCYLSLLL